MILRRSKEELVYELNAADVPTEKEKEEYDIALKKLLDAPAALPAGPSTRTPNSSHDDRNYNKWKDVDVWKEEDSGVYHYTLNFSECREKKHFLMSCTPADSTSSAKPFLFVGKVKTVNNDNQTFCYTTCSVVNPANAYDASCLEGKWISLSHCAQKEPANHSDVLMYFKLNCNGRLPAAAKDRVREMCLFLNVK